MSDTPDLTVIVPVSAIIPACQRVEPLLQTLNVILSCNPPPAEILVHLDGADPVVEAALSPFASQIRLLKSPSRLGPGGSRQKLIEAAQHELVANFDDDSSPAHPNYFGCILAEAERSSEWAVLSAITLHDDSPPPVGENTDDTYRRMGVFSGCGCVFRKSWFQRISGYVPVPVGYFMEEADVSLQLHAAGATLWESPHLWVHHHAPEHQDSSAPAMAHSLANIVLLGYLRFPVWLWALIPAQALSRLLWMARRGWFHGIREGLALIPHHLSHHRRYRHVLPGCAILSWLRLRHRREPIRMSLPAPLPLPPL